LRQAASCATLQSQNHVATDVMVLENKRMANIARY